MATYRLINNSNEDQDEEDMTSSEYTYYEKEEHCNLDSGINNAQDLNEFLDEEKNKQIDIDNQTNCMVAESIVKDNNKIKDNTKNYENDNCDINKIFQVFEPR